jgi:MarR family transcriptional regulator, negative regulator of the multidrug operon emrRAB
MQCSSESEDRTANLLGVLALAVSDRLDVALRSATGRPMSDTVALVVLTTELTGASQDTLGRVLNLSQPGAARLVDRLVASELCERRPGPDGRTHAVVPTAAGRAVAAAALRARTDAVRALLAPLDERDRADLTRVASKVLSALTEDRHSALRLCRLCDTATCGHRRGECPVTNAVDGHSSTTTGPSSDMSR